MNPAENLWRRLRASSFLSNVLTMLSGTIVAQVIPMAIAPVLTRLYAPEDYGRYALFMLVSYTASALASLRYEFGIMLPEKEHAAAGIVVLCFGIAAALCVALFAGTALTTALHVDAFGISRLGAWAHLIPVMVLFQSMYQTLSYWLLRKQAFRHLAASRIFRATVMAVCNVSMGLFSVRGGLIVSSVLGQVFATAILLVRLARSDREDFRKVTRSAIWVEARRHRRFALFALPADLMSTVAQQFPVMLLPVESAGSFAFVQNVVNAPVNFVAGAVLDAFKEKAARDFRERGEFRAVFRTLLKTLSLMAAPGGAVLALFGPALFTIVFGAPWREAGEMARILSIVVVFKLVASPLSYSYYIVERQFEDFILHIYVALSSATCIIYGIRVAHSTPTALLLFSINYSFVYILYLIRSWQFSSGKKQLLEPPNLRTG